MSNVLISVGEKIREFTLEDTHGNPITLSDFHGRKNVFLVFNRGFV